MQTDITLPESVTVDGRTFPVIVDNLPDGARIRIALDGIVIKPACVLVQRSLLQEAVWTLRHYYAREIRREREPLDLSDAERRKLDAEFADVIRDIYRAHAIATYGPLGNAGPWTCPHCGRVYKTPGGFGTHVRGVHRVDPFSGFNLDDLA